jgi:hypothetical protein
VGIENVIMGEVVGMNGSFNIFCLETFGLGWERIISSLRSNSLGYGGFSSFIHLISNQQYNFYLWWVRDIDHNLWENTYDGNKNNMISAYNIIYSSAHDRISTKEPLKELKTLLVSYKYCKI